MMTKLLDSFRAARLRGVPIVSISTPDQPATVQAIVAAENGKVGPNAPLISWDIVTGMRPANPAGEMALKGLVGIDPATFNTDQDATLQIKLDAERQRLGRRLTPEETDVVKETRVAEFQQAVKKLTLDPEAALTVARRLPGYSEVGGNLGAALFLHNAHAVLDHGFPTHAAVRQAAANLRDLYKASNRMLVFLGPEIELPPELRDDTIPLVENYPDEAQLREIVLEQHRGAGLVDPDIEVMRKALDALRGIAAFPAEQITAMSLKRDGVDIEMLRERKYVELEKVPGLTVHRKKITMAQVGGKAQFKKLLRGVFEGRKRPGLLVIIDEGEKFMTGGGSDSHEVSKDQLAVFLKEMEDKKYSGAILASAPGVGKTLVAMATAGEYDVICVSLDFGATKVKWVGSSEKNIRALFRAIEAAAGPGGAFFILTCNKMKSLPPELRRRFTRGIWYDELPTAVEKAEIWAIQLAAYGLPLDSVRPDDTGWTGADIRNCCDAAWALDIPLTEATEFMVPVSKSDPGSIEELRTLARGSFLSTAYPGPYRGPVAEPEPETVVVAKASSKRTSRRINVED